MNIANPENYWTGKEEEEVGAEVESSAVVVNSQNEVPRDVPFKNAAIIVTKITETVSTVID